MPEDIFPEIVPSTQIVGTLTKEAARAFGLTTRVKVACGGVDNSCMALGARNIKEGRVYTSLGSSAWIAVSSKKPVLDARVKPFVFAHVVPELFTSAVSIFAAGSSFKWLRDTILPLGSASQAADRDLYEVMNDMAASSPVGANKLIFNPSLAGGSSQEATPHIRGCFAGLDLRHTCNDMVRAAMEGIAMNLGAVLEVLRRFVPLGASQPSPPAVKGKGDWLRAFEVPVPFSPTGEMLMVGGGSRSRLWRQIFADIYDMEIIKTNIDQEAGSLGAAAVAAVGSGVWPNFDKIDEIHKIEAIERPLPQNTALYRKLRPAFEYVRHCQAELGDLLHGIDM